MTEQRKPEESQIKHLDDFKGTPPEVIKQKAEWISIHGYAAYEELVRKSSIRVKR